MADTWTTTVTGNSLTLTLSGASTVDWIWGDKTPGPINNFGAFLEGVQFTPTWQNDRLIIRDGSITGAIICELFCAEGAPATKTWDNPNPMAAVVKPVIDYSACTFTRPASVTIVLNIA